MLLLYRDVSYSVRYSPWEVRGFGGRYSKIRVFDGKNQD